MIITVGTQVDRYGSYNKLSRLQKYASKVRLKINVDKKKNIRLKVGNIPLCFQVDGEVSLRRNKVLLFGYYSQIK